MSTRKAAALVAGLGVAMTLTAAACGGSGGGGSSSPLREVDGHVLRHLSGTFVLNRTQSGSRLSGTIKLSTAGTDNGTVDGSSIKVGTVGGDAVHYTGTVSGDSTSGSCSTAAGGGTWSAHKA
jgi:hypothetical protein